MIIIHTNIQRRDGTAKMAALSTYIKRYQTKAEFQILQYFVHIKKGIDNCCCCYNFPSRKHQKHAQQLIFSLTFP
jgi:hypothetical protein